MFGIEKSSVRARSEANGHDIILKNVLDVPEASANLLSVRAVAASGHSITFCDQGISTREKTSGKIIVHGKSHCGLCASDMTVMKPAYTTRVYLARPIPSLQQYHEHFAHQDKQYVKQLLERIKIEAPPEDDGICHGCVAERMHRLPYRSRKDRATAVGGLYF